MHRLPARASRSPPAFSIVGIPAARRARWAGFQAGKSADALRPVALGVVKLAAAGERHQARDAARAAAVEIGESLARSSWSESEDDWDAKAAIEGVRRV